MSSAPRSSRARRLLRGLGRALAALVLGLLVLFGTLALALDADSRVLALAFALGSLALFVGRPARRARRLAWVVLYGALLAWWLALEPRNDRDWQPDVARLPGARVEGEQLTFSAVRDFDWTSDDTAVERWEERTVALADVRGVDLVVCDWGAPGIVHTILSFGFADGTQLAFSVETRKERGESYSAVRGLFRQYELYYAVASERDLLGVRAAFRGEHLRLYPLALAPDAARELLLLYARRIEELTVHPAWYHAVAQSCTSTIRRHVRELGFTAAYDWRLLANAHLDELLLERGGLALEPATAKLSLAELRQRQDITDSARAALTAPPAEFSALLRRELAPLTAPAR